MATPGRSPPGRVGIDGIDRSARAPGRPPEAGRRGACSTYRTLPRGAGPNPGGAARVVHTGPPSSIAARGGPRRGPGPRVSRAERARSLYPYVRNSIAAEVSRPEDPAPARVMPSNFIRRKSVRRIGRPSAITAESGDRGIGGVSVEISQSSQKECDPAQVDYDRVRRVASRTGLASLSASALGLRSLADGPDEHVLALPVRHRRGDLGALQQGLEERGGGADDERAEVLEDVHVLVALADVA